jgi:hypothetical protein
VTGVPEYCKGGIARYRPFRTSSAGQRGDSPALLVIDFTRAFTDPALPLGSNLDWELLETVRVLGAVVMPPMPAFYHRPATVEEITDQTVNRALDLLDIEIEQDLFPRWQGPAEQAPRPLTNGKAHHHDLAEARPPA